MRLDELLKMVHLIGQNLEFRDPNPQQCGIFEVSGFAPMFSSKNILNSAYSIHTMKS